MKTLILTAAIFSIAVLATLALHEPAQRVDATSLQQRLDVAFPQGWQWPRTSKHLAQAITNGQANRPSTVILVSRSGWLELVANGLDARGRVISGNVELEVFADGTAQLGNPPALGHVKVYTITIPGLGNYVGVQFLP